MTTMTDEKLIARLRDEHVAASRTEAADRIETLTAQLESTLKDRALIMAERDRTFALMLARVEKAEADAAAMEAEAHAHIKMWGEALKDRDAARAELARVREALVDLIQHTYNCEKELTEELHHADFCGESVPLTNARAALTTQEPKP